MTTTDNTGSGAPQRIVDLIGENFDRALRYGQLRDDATLAARRILDLQGGLYASPAYLKGRGMPEEPEALREHQALYTLTSGSAPGRVAREPADYPTSGRRPVGFTLHGCRSLAGISSVCGNTAGSARSGKFAEVTLGQELLFQPAYSREDLVNISC